MSAESPDLVIDGVNVPSYDGLCNVIIRDGAISDITRASSALTSSTSTLADGDARWLIPGWIDLQVNDIEWFDCVMRRDSVGINEHARRIEQVLQHQLNNGVTHLLLATLASPLNLLKNYLKGAKQVMESGKQGKLPDSCLGGCLVEGTFMNPSCCGCHNPAYVYLPSWSLAQKLVDTGAVQILNVAPEIGDEADALDVVLKAKEAGVVVAVGHAKPHAVMLRKAVDAGCSYVIHLGNGPTGSSWKSFNDGGMMEEALRNDYLTVSIIADFIHVHPCLLRDWIARKEISRVIAISDQAFATGLGKRKSFEVFGRLGKVSDDGSHLLAVDSESGESSKMETNRTSEVAGLFGSCISMKQIFENVLNLMFHAMDGVYIRHHEGQCLSDAIRSAISLCSTNPARLLKLDHHCGDVKVGLDATLLLVNVTERKVRPGDTWFGCMWETYLDVTLEKVIYHGKVVR